MSAGRGDGVAPARPRNPDFERVVRESFARQGLMGLLGAELVAVRAGEVEIRVAYRDELSQQHGSFHAGVAGAIADSAGGYAALSLMAPGSSIVSVEYKLNMLAPARGDALHAIGRVVRSGRTLTVCTGEVFVERDGGEGNDAGRELCTLMQQTLFRLEASADRPEG